MYTAIRTRYARPWIGLGLAAASAATFFSGSARADDGPKTTISATTSMSCTKHTDCPGAESCQAGRCVDLTGGAAPAAAPAAPAAAATTTPVVTTTTTTTKPASGQLYDVEFDGPTGGHVSVEGHTCTTPCTLRLDPERSTKVSFNNQQFPFKLEGPAKVDFSRRSPGLLIVGLVFMSVGGGILLGSYLSMDSDDGRTAVMIASGSGAGLGFLFTLLGAANLSQVKAPVVNGVQMPEPTAKRTVTGPRFALTGAPRGHGVGFRLDF